MSEDNQVSRSLCYLPPQLYFLLKSKLYFYHTRHCEAYFHNRPRLSFIYLKLYTARMPSDTYYPPSDLINIDHLPIIRNHLCISLSNPTLVTTELLTLRQVAHQRKQKEAVNSNYQLGTNAMRFLTKIRSFCTISFGKHGSLSANGAPPACISLSDLTLGTSEVFSLPQVARQCKQEAMNSNYRPGETAMRYLTKICTIACRKPGFPPPNCVQPSYNFLSDAPETIIIIHSVSSLATTDADDTFVTADEYIHVPNLAPLASEVVREELYIRGYLKRPDKDSRFLRQPRCIVIPRLLQVLHDRWPKQVAAIPVSPKSPQHLSPQAIGRRGGLTVAKALKSANIEENPLTPILTRSSPSDQSIYWSCKSPQTALNSSPSPLAQETSMSTTQFCDFCEHSYITLHTTPPSSPELAGLSEKDVLDTTSPFSEAALWSLAPRVALMKAKHSSMEVDARSFQRLRYGEVCHHILV
ncbi:hypothetical protein DFJ58DRAFT_744378 [Suillus subalutaceus]|uniref:uncharacterized protein n=1 Tax=Suillus subalutaceus TaxID=48586 RepID=UPI001B86909E|nr:uncharacterized protein DFJ58DRAFT_744378 [Suillus subalutaceus]KAG1860642.1 hypothetical protein DFJ58DRAFT_744378 [Suillus subalutaceus]